MYSHNKITNALLIRGAFLFFLLSLLSGCVNKKPAIQVSAQEVNTEISLQEFQARLTDIAFPLDLTLKAGSAIAAPGGMEWMLSGSSKSTMETIRTFYHQEMERLGWWEVIMSDGDHPSLVLLFEKPTKICIVTVEPESRTQLIRYFIAPRT